MAARNSLRTFPFQPLPSLRLRTDVAVRLATRAQAQSPTERKMKEVLSVREMVWKNMRSHNNRFHSITKKIVSLACVCSHVLALCTYNAMNLGLRKHFTWRRNLSSFSTLKLMTVGGLKNHAPRFPKSRTEIFQITHRDFWNHAAWFFESRSVTFFVLRHRLSGGRNAVGWLM